MSVMSIHRPTSLEGWRIEQRGDAARPFFVLLKPEGRVYAQGSQNLCKAVLSSLKYHDTADQLTERFLFHHVYREMDFL